MATLTPEQQQAYSRRRLGLESQAELDRRRLQEDYDINSRYLRGDSERGVEAVGDQMASQGLFNSGIRINEQGQVVRRANEALADLNLGRSRGLEDVGRNLTSGLAGLDSDIARELAEITRRDQEFERQRALQEAISRAPRTPAIQYPSPIIPLPQMPQFPNSRPTGQLPGTYNKPSFGLNQILQDLVRGDIGDLSSLLSGPGRTKSLTTRPNWTKR